MGWYVGIKMRGDDSLLLADDVCRDVDGQHVVVVFCLVDGKYDSTDVAILGNVLYAVVELTAAVLAEGYPLAQRHTELLLVEAVEHLLDVQHVR